VSLLQSALFSLHNPWLLLTVANILKYVIKLTWMLLKTNVSEVYRQHHHARNSSPKLLSEQKNRRMLFMQLCLYINGTELDPQLKLG